LEAQRSYEELEQMSEVDGPGPTMVIRKRKRGSGFRYSTKKALEHSKLSKEAAKGRVLELGSVKKALTYPIELLSEIGVVDFGDCSTGPTSLHSVDENEAERIDVSIEIADTITECIRKVSIIKYILFGIHLCMISIVMIVIGKAE
jgi:hypothetical protein